MFNSSLKKSALEIHGNAVERYNVSYKKMQTACEALHAVRERAIGKIIAVEVLINSIANRPKEFDKRLGEIKQYVLKFHQTKEYADEAYKEAMKSGVNILAGVAAGGAIATAAPSMMMSIATTFGTASTGTAISSLSGAVAQKAAVAWIGRVTKGIATKGIVKGAGMASGHAFMALSGPIGWSITGVSTATSLVSLSSKNKKISQEATEEAKSIMTARSVLIDTTNRVENLKKRTEELLDRVYSFLREAERYKNMDYLSLEEKPQLLLGTLVNNTLSLAALLNETVE